MCSCENCCNPFSSRTVEIILIIFTNKIKSRDAGIKHLKRLFQQSRKYSEILLKAFSAFLRYFLQRRNCSFKKKNITLLVAPFIPKNIKI